MFKKFLFIILTINLLSNCDYKPVYTSLDNSNFQIVLSEINGDKDLNKFIIDNLQKNIKNKSQRIISVSIQTTYSKDILAKNTAGSVTDFQIRAKANFKIDKGQNSETFVVNEKFNFQKMSDKYEEKNYEKNIKRNIATIISQKLMLRLAVTE